MAKAYKLKIEGNDLIGSVNGFLKKLFSENIIGSLLVPQETTSGKFVIQSLAASEAEIDNADIFAPLLVKNSAALVSRLTVDNTPNKVGVVLRSCEIRAVIELVKLKQINLDNLIIIGVDCMGTYESKVFEKASEKFENTKKLTEAYLAASGKAEAAKVENAELRQACQGCLYPNPENADIAINFLGCDAGKEIFIQLSGKLEGIEPEKLGLAPGDDAGRWADASKACIERRTKYRDDLLREVLAEVKDIEGFLKQLEQCRRCYNCRRECPICYCRECIFDSLTFEHDSEQYFSWAQKKGKIRMPTDTLLFHLTRMNHMVISCVACGQCTSACPNDIPVANFFKTIGAKVQELFDYVPGRSVEEENPQATFKEDEFPEVGESGSEC